MNKEAFYDQYNVEFGALSESQVAGLDFLLGKLDVEQPDSLEKAAYMLATTAHETAWTYEPVAEAYWVEPDAEAWRAENLDYYPWYGRGYVQLTWEDNYVRAGNELGKDFTTNPNVVMEPVNAWEVMFEGMMAGWFTGMCLGDYIYPGYTDYVGAREVINGTDCDDQIAGYAESFEQCLQAAGYVVVPQPRPIICDLPTITEPFANTLATRLLCYVLRAIPRDLATAIVTFQEDHGLTADGICGNDTWLAIQEAGAIRLTVPPTGKHPTRQPPLPMTT